MPWPAIRKTAWPNSVIPNVMDYDDAVAEFTWGKARHHLDGLPNGAGSQHRARNGRPPCHGAQCRDHRPTSISVSQYRFEKQDSLPLPFIAPTN